MRLTIERDALLRTLGFVAAAVERRVTIPILANVLIEAANDGVRLVATDLEMQIAARLSGQVETPGGITVGAQMLLGIVRELDEGSQVAIELDGERLKVASGRSRYKLPTQPAQDFPKFQSPEPNAALVLPCGGLLTALKSVAFAMSNEETRYYLMGIHIDARDGKIAFAATNGHLLASVTRDAPKGAEALERGIIIHRKMVGELVKMLDGAEGEIDLVTDHQLIKLVLGDIEISAKLVEGDYPDWRRFVPAGHPNIIKVRGAALAAAVRRAVVVAEDKTRSVRADFKGECVLVRSRGALSGEAEEEVPCFFDGAEFAIGLQSRYVLDTLDAIGSDDIEVALEPVAPAGMPAASTLFTSPARPDGQWVIMPMRV